MQVQIITVCCKYTAYKNSSKQEKWRCNNGIFEHLFFALLKFKINVLDNNCIPCNIKSVNCESSEDGGTIFMKVLLKTTELVRSS